MGKKKCEALGAVLATILDETSNDFIKAKLNGNSWIGGENKNGPWEWHNGDEWDFEKWKNGEGQSADECAAMMTNGKWIDKACNTKMDYVCMEEKASTSYNLKFISYLLKFAYCIHY